MSEMHYKVTTPDGAELTLTVEHGQVIGFVPHNDALRWVRSRRFDLVLLLFERQGCTVVKVEPETEVSQ